MQKTEDRIFQKRHHVPSLSAACGQGRPKTFMPFVAHVAPYALRHQTIHDQRANLPLGDVVRRTDLRVAMLSFLLRVARLPIFLPRLVDEQKVTLAMLFKTLGNRNRLVVLRNKSPNRLLNRFFVSIHQTLETDLRQLTLSMNRCEHLFDVFQQTLAVRLRVVQRRQELDLANQVCPTKLKKRFRLLLVLQIRRKEVAADAAGKIFAERCFQNLAAARHVDLEKREELRNETPCPLQLAVLLEARFVDMKMALPFQKFRKLFIRRLECRRCFFDLLDEKPRADIDADDIAKILLERAIRNVTSAFEIRGQRDHLRPEEAGFFDFVRQGDVVITLAMPAPIHELLILRDEERFFDEFDLRDFRRGVGEIELVSAIGALGQFELDDFVDEFRRDGFSQILLVTLLSPLFSLDFPLRFRIVGRLVLRRLDNIRRLRLRRVAGIFFEHGDAFQQLRNRLIALTQFRSKLRNDFFHIHNT